MKKDLERKIRIVKRRLQILFKRRMKLFVIKEKVLFLVKSIRILLSLVIAARSYRVIVVWSRISTTRISTIIPDPTCYFYRDTNRTEIEPITNKHEWRSVSFIRQSRSLHDGRFMLSSLKEGQANILGTTKRRVPLAEKQKGSFHTLAALATLKRNRWNPLFDLDLDREKVNINRPILENPLYKELKPDDLEDEELVQLIRQRYTPIQIERIWNVIETKSEGSRESDP